MREELRKEIDSIVSQVIKNYRPEKIILFGSAAHGEFTEDSDIDLLIVKNTEQPFTERLRELYRTLDYNIALDILVYTQDEIDKYRPQSYFIQDIFEKGIVLYEQ